MKYTEVRSSHRLFSKRLLLMLSLGSLLVFAGCSDQHAPDSTPENNAFLAQTKNQTQDASAVVLAFDGSSITLNEIDEQIKLKLYDLDWARYELRQSALAEYVQTALKASADKQQELKIEVLLTPPMPPRVALSKAQADTALRFDKQADSAPVKLSVFCNYQSSHCARMQLSYQTLLDEYAEALVFEFFDFPQAFHLFAIPASQAARCAKTMGQFEAFHKALWAVQDSLGKETYLRLARQLNLDETRFTACLEDPSHRKAIEVHTELAQSLGFNNVPVTLINGLYINGPKSVDTFRYFIDQELVRLGVSDNKQANEGKAAYIANETEEAALTNETAAEAGIQQQESRAGTTSLYQAASLPADMPDREELEYQPRPLVPALGETPLSRQWLDDQLLQESELKSHFQAAEHEVEGLRLTKLQNIRESEFYRTLGMQEGDVIMRVNDQWVHEAQNDLFNLLATESRISVAVIRKGLPVQLVYVVSDEQAP